MHLVTVSAAMTSSRLYENGITVFLEAGRRGPMLAMPAMLCSLTPAMVAKEKGPAAVPTGKVEASEKEKVDVEDGKNAAVKAINEDGGGSAAAADGDGRSFKPADGGTSKVRCRRCGRRGHWRIDCTEELCSRCHGRGHAADVCPTSKEGAVLAASDDDDDSDADEASAFKARETGKCSNVSGKKGDGVSAWQVGDEASLFDSGASTHMTPSADQL